jgi:tetratricopeptide (TPR) repeat protein
MAQFALWRRLLLVLLSLCTVTVATWAQPAAPLQSRQQALRALSEPGADARTRAVNRLGQVGAMADTPRLVERLRDDSEQVRDAAAAALWGVWGRSGDPSVDRLYQQGVRQMEAGRLQEARQIFSEIVRRKPEFAEGWNKRATILFLMGDLESSLKDCDEVIRRNPNHFGVLSGYGQIHLQLGDLERALHYLERALAINPNMDGVASTVIALKQMLQFRPGQKV